MWPSSHLTSSLMRRNASAPTPSSCPDRARGSADGVGEVEWVRSMAEPFYHNFWISKVQSFLPEAFTSSNVVEKSGPIISESWQLWESYPAPSYPPELMRSEKRERGHRCDEDILAPWQGLPALQSRHRYPVIGNRILIIMHSLPSLIEKWIDWAPLSVGRYVLQVERVHPIN
jgi:hypothetical protein